MNPSQPLAFSSEAEVTLSASTKNFLVRQRQRKLNFNLNFMIKPLHHKNTIPKLRDFNLKCTTTQLQHHSTIRKGRLLNFNLNHTTTPVKLLIIFNLDYLHHNTITSPKPWQLSSHPTAVHRLNQTQRTCHCTPTRTCPLPSPR